MTRDLPGEAPDAAVDPWWCKECSPGLKCGRGGSDRVGNNAAYRAFERTAIGLYDLGKLDAKSLDVVAGVYRGTDIDSGGSEGLKARDGKDLMEVVLFVMKPKRFAAIQKLPKGSHGESDPPYYEALYEGMWKLCRDRWGWC